MNIAGRLKRTEPGVRARHVAEVLAGDADADPRHRRELSEVGAMQVTAARLRGERAPGARGSGAPIGAGQDQDRLGGGARRAAERLPEFEALRDLGRDIKDHTLAHLDLYLEAFEARVAELGGTVHWARDAAEARAVVLELCQAADARTVTKSKSMVTEEIGLNAFLESHGLEPVETDLGEYILQIAHQPPSTSSARPCT